MADKPANIWRQTLKRRLTVAAVACVLWTIGIEARLVYLQVFRHSDLSGRAERQQSRTIESPGKRGEILDRNGRVLAQSVDAETVYASDIADPKAAAASLCRALGDCTPRERQAMAERLRTRRQFAYVRRQISPDQARRVATLQLEGIGFMKESQRRYPNKEFAAHLLGYVGTDNVGLSGIEATHNRLIMGSPGTVLVQNDARRRVFSRVERPPTTGASLELTIDEYVQYTVERELRAAVVETRAAGGTAVVMDPNTGEILALASYPTFNPNAYRQAREDARRNRAVQDVYEPGSTFKIITASAALEEHVVRPDDPIDVSGGTIRFGSRVIRDDHKYGVIPFREVIAKSSNVGSIKVGLRLGGETFGRYVRGFGFGRRSSPDFPGENAGIVWDPAKLNDSALASMFMGYQVAVTPIQMASAVSAVANGGELIEPRVVRAVIRDGHRRQVPRKVVGRVISEGTAAELRSMLEGVVEPGGTATRAAVEGYTVAGKTGTAAKLVDGRYSNTEYNASFVGFVPSRKPAFTIVVVIDSPRAVSIYGGLVAAPVFQKVADAILRHAGVTPTINAPPPLLIARGERGPQQPTSGPTAPPVVTVAPATADGAAVIPDLTGVNARDALRVLSKLGMSTRLHGTGLVTSQRPRAGAPIDSGVPVHLWLGRQPAVVVATAATP